MKFFMLIIVIYSCQLFALDIGGGIRETFVSSDHFNFGSDSVFRIRRNLSDRNFASFYINTKLVTAPINPSYIYRPSFSSSQKDLTSIIHQINQGNKKAILKPQIVANDNFVNIALEEIVSPNLDTNLMLFTYQKELEVYLNLTKTTMVSEIVIGSGVNHLYSNHDNLKEVENLHRYIREKLTSHTSLALNITSAKVLSNLQSHPENAAIIGKYIDKIYYNINSLNLQALNGSDQDLALLRLQLEDLYRQHIRFFPKLKFAISDVFLPLCKEGKYEGLNYNCEKGLKGTEKLNVFTSFGTLISDLIRSGINISDVEVILGVTDFEPENPRPEYFLYDKEFKLLDIEKVFHINQSKKEVATPIKEENGNFEYTACIYYDVGDLPERKDLIGRVHAETLKSLMGAFKNYQTIKKPLNEYVPRELFNCDKAFYLASNFLTKIPELFLEDVSEYIKENDFFWFNYKLNQFYEHYKKEIGFSSPYVIPADSTPTAANTDVGFFQYFDYKGETFFKNHKWNPISDTFTSSPEINFIDITDKSNVEILAWARHNKTDKKIPYAVKQNVLNGSMWYIADSPFSFIHYEDRYLIFTDIIWDFLDVTPPSGPPKAMVRIEDINPSLNLADLNWAMSYLKSNDVPFSLALIPYFSDLLGSEGVDQSRPVFQPATKFKSFVGSLLYAKSLDADIVFHGVAHQVDDFISGYDGVTGSDYEFWLYPENVPIPYDSVDWVMDRLEMGEKVFSDLGLKPVAWEIPHYAASVLDYYIFGKVFEWTFHRSILFHHELIQDTALPDKYQMFDCVTPECRKKRREILRNIQVEVDYGTFGASLFPYPIYSDSYGQKIIPETLGMVDFAYYAKNTWRPVNTPYDILRRAKKLRVIRGAMGTFFWHTHLLSSKLLYYRMNPESFEEFGGKRSLTLIINGLRDLGYEFISISDCKYFPRKGCNR